MRRTCMKFIIPFVCGIALGLLGARVLTAQEPIRRTILQQQALEGVPGREAIQFVADIAPGAVVGKHTHPGPEFGYVVEGTLVLEQAGQPPMTVNVGDSFHVPDRRVHWGKNGSPTKPVKVLGMVIGEKGQPLATPVKD